MVGIQKVSGFELKHIENELQILLDAKVDKIYLLSKKDIIFNFHKTGIGKKSLHIILPHTLYFTDKKFSPPERPLGYCTFLRKYLGNSRLRYVKMVGGERILDFLFETKDDKFHLFLEFFDKGNAILTDEKLLIKSPLENQNWKDRTIRGGVDYIFPQKSFNLFDLNFDAFKSQIDGEILKSLVFMGVGKEYALDILKRSKIDAKQTNLKDDELLRVFNSLKKTIQAPTKCFVSKNRVYVTDLVDVKDLTAFNSISEGFDSIITPEVKDPNSKVKAKTLKLQKIIEAQSKRKDELEKSSEQDLKKGEAIYENYSLISDILNQIKDARKKLSWDEIKEKLKGHKIIKKINSAKGIITINLEDKNV